MLDSHDDERELRDRFRALRDEERAAAPGFARPPIGTAARRGFPRRPRPVLHFSPMAAAAAVLLLVASAGTGIVLLARGGESGIASSPAVRIPTVAVSPPDVMSGEWTSPTDFLLATPGAELLHDVPTFEGLGGGQPRRPRTSPSSSTAPNPGRSFST